VDFYCTYLSLFTLVTSYLNNSFVHSRNLHFATIWKSCILSFVTSVSLGGPGKHYINCILLPLDFHIICDFVRPQLSAYYHFLRFQSYSHCLEIRHSDRLQFTLSGSTLGFVLLKGETETPLPTPPHLL